MGSHQDKDERSDAPVVSLSIGDTCVLGCGNTETRGQPYTDIELRSGDLFVFGGSSRFAYARRGSAKLDRALEVQPAAQDRGLQRVQADAVERQRREAVPLDADRVAGRLGIDDVADVLELADRGAVDLVDRVTGVERAIPPALQVGVRQPINLTKCRLSSSGCSRPRCFRS